MHSCLAAVGDPCHVPFPDVKIKDAAKKIGRQFACGSSVSKAPSGAEEVVIQGDVLLDLPEFLETTFNVSDVLLIAHGVRSRSSAMLGARSRVRINLMNTSNTVGGSI